MKFYGLHFYSDDKTPLQVAVDMSKQQVFARSCPNGEWTAWRRLDVMRNADGTLAEEVAEATHAKRADTAGKFARPMKIVFTGDVTGTASFDGSEDISVRLYASGITRRLSELEGRVAGLSISIEDISRPGTNNDTTNTG